MWDSEGIFAVSVGTLVLLIVVYFPLSAKPRTRQEVFQAAEWKEVGSPLLNSRTYQPILRCGSSESGCPMLRTTLPETREPSWNSLSCISWLAQLVRMWAFGLIFQPFSPQGDA